MKARQIETRKEKEDLFSSKTFPRPKTLIYPKPIAFSRCRKLGYLPINVSVEEMDKFKDKEMSKKASFTSQKKLLVSLAS